MRRRRGRARRRWGGLRRLFRRGGRGSRRKSLGRKAWPRRQLLTTRRGRTETMLSDRLSDRILLLHLPAELFQGSILNLANAFAGHPEFAADLFERLRIVSVDAETFLQNHLLSFGKRGEDLSHEISVVLF